ncbi:hypothetical protein GCWU000325_02199 [Alloprevotella tannerae ATCC 51259]|uniref:Uncharacterized protein n=1 Tax=Alloprevotella tannerae ATCC 51259 TaxID=626522 RepID=C9LIY8_9BACT|nr:hypothetical protein GCWU000325_02199 [Alloprevotella tannerae ATCC 51259]
MRFTYASNLPFRSSFFRPLHPLKICLGESTIKKIREIIKQNSINKRIFDNKTMKYQSK